MKSQENWFKFVISGSIEDYLNYINSSKKEEVAQGGGNTFYN